MKTKGFYIDHLGAMKGFEKIIQEMNDVNVVDDMDDDKNVKKSKENTKIVNKNTKVIKKNTKVIKKNTKVIKKNTKVTKKKVENKKKEKVDKNLVMVFKDNKVVYNHDCRLFYDKINDKYTLLIPVDIERKNIVDRHKIVALDPGEKIFMSYFGLDHFGHFGHNIREKIMNERNKISKYQSALSKKKNKRKEKLKCRKKLNKKIENVYKRINNIVKDLHNQTASYLCKNYDMILIPEFATQQMVKKVAKVEIDTTCDSYNKRKKIVSQAYEKSKEEGKMELKKYTKRKRLDKKVKFVLNMLSHYKFRQHLIQKGDEYGCRVEVVTEEYTSKACTKCGEMSENYDKNRQKTCRECGYKIDRDINGSRNILIKNMKEYII
jgi:putative transposase